MGQHEDAAVAALAERLKTASVQIGPRRLAAKAAGVSVGQWDRYIAGISAPSFLAVARFAAAARVSMTWLAFGEGSMHPAPPAIDEELLAEIVELIEMEAARRGDRPDPLKYAGLVTLCYREEMRHAEAGRRADPAQVRLAFRLVS